MQFAQQYYTKLGILLVGDMGFQCSVPSRLLGKKKPRNLCTRLTGSELDEPGKL
jgi:hypothetical protein